ncbi:MAG: hypothetical protein ACE15D_16920 [Candidatus Eisenbacteria bacterium]|nr:hypothetical protein [Candidatus Eisenbacteria bacterium]
MNTRIAAACIAALLGAVSIAQAADPQGWQVEITPCAWIAGIEGTVTVGGQETDFDKSAGDLFDYVQFAGGVIGTVQYERWVCRTQFDYFGLSTDALDVKDRPEGGEMESDMFLTEIGAGYQIDGWMEGQTYDLLLTLRYLRAENDLVVYGDPTDYSKTSDIVDPMFAMRAGIPIFPSKIQGLRLNLLAAIGGGGDSKLVYEMQPQIQYRFLRNVAARLGYRRVAWQLDSDKNDDEMDFTLAGLNLGIGVTF